MKTVVVVQGASGAAEVPGLERIADEAELRFASGTDDLEAALPGAEILLGWDFRASELRAAWPAAQALRWIHWAGAGIDAVLFRELVASDVVLTNARGVFDRSMAEYVLGLILAFAKRFPETVRLQATRTWRHRLTERVDGRRALVVGPGSIGRAIGRLLRAAGLEVTAVGRRERADDPDFGRVHARSSLPDLLPEADFVIIVTPFTAETRHLFGPAEFRAMKREARLINVARGAIVDQQALIAALEAGEIAGAALDVFEDEPLPVESPLWGLSNVIVSPHMSGDFEGHRAVLAEGFLENFARWRAGRPLRNVVDKSLGFVPANPTPSAAHGT